MPDGTAPDWASRLHQIDTYCRTRGLEAVVVSAPANLRYLTGFSGSSALLVTGPFVRIFITDGRYDESVRQQMTAGRLARLAVKRVDGRYDLTLADTLAELGVRQVGFEAGHVTVATLNHWRAAVPAIDWQTTDDLVEGQRVVKDETEQAIFRRAGRLLSDVARHVGEWVAVGRTEREVARDIDRALERGGFERPAFDTIVAGGPNSAYPHARPTDRALGPGELVVLDFGGVLDGYCVDLTRMAGLGHLDDAAARLVAAVRDAQTAAINAVRADVPGSDVDRAARATLEQHGLADAFLHGTGHGLGLEVHEAPRLARAESGARDVLRAGMVCTIEPGAYVAGLGGVRLEDDVLVTAGGCELLTDAPRELIAIR